MLPLRYLCQLFTTTTCLFTIAGAVSPPECQTTAPSETILNHIYTAQTNVSGPPFGVAYAAHQNIAFIGTNTTLGVLDTSKSPVRLIHEIPLPPELVYNSDYAGALGVSMTHSGRYVLVAIGPGAAILDAEKAVVGARDAVVGTVKGTVGVSATQIVSSKDDKYIFISQEYSRIPELAPPPVNQSRGAIDVFEVCLPNGKKATSFSSKYVGYLPLGYSVVGIALSQDGKNMYVTSEVEYPLTKEQGTLSVIDVQTLVKNPSKALLSSVPAGCSPVRAIVSPSGKETVWVTAREANHLLAFDTGKLKSNATDALLASVQVGTSPVGLVFAKQGKRVLTADSNRFLFSNTTKGLSVVDVDAALKGRANAVLGQIPASTFPREIVLSPDGKTVLVTEYGAEQVLAVDVSRLP
jgi:sugar lactone lactonase YvrE